MKKSIFSIISFICFFSLGSASFSQRIIPEDSYDVYRQIKQLNNLTHVLYLAAHPDDENTRLLSYFVHEKNFKTFYLSLTRGEGGQNLIGQELGKSLGLIRNYELNAARDLDGAEQLFTSTIDFGFSKNPEEVFNFWNKDKIVQETQEIIQKIRPDVIICRFPTTGEGGHGQHTASALIALEAFQNTLNDHTAFHPQRLLFNAFRFGGNNTIKEGQFNINTQQYLPHIGMSYGQLAGISRSIHRSQGAGTPQSIGIEKEYFDLMAGEPVHNDIIDRNISWERVDAPEIGHEINKIINQYDFSQPQKSIPALIQLKKHIKREVKDEFWKSTKIQEIDKIIIASSGLMLEALSQVPETPTNKTIKIKFNAISRTNNTVIKNVKWSNNNLFTQIPLSNDLLFTTDMSIEINNNQKISQPFWLEKSPQDWHYDYSNDHLMDYSIVNYPQLKVTVNIEGEEFKIDLPIGYKYLHPTRGDVTEFLRITPDVVINPLQEILFVKENSENIVKLAIKTYNPFEDLTIQILNENNTIIQQKTLNHITPGKDTMVQIPLQSISEISEKVRLQVVAKGKVYQKAQEYIKYDHLPELVHYHDAEIKIVKPDWVVPQQKIAYIHGAGDNIPTIMKNIGLNIDVLPENTLSQLTLLQSYSTVVLGVRAYNTLAQMNNYMDILLQYVQQGGRLVVQYNTSNNLLTQKLGPYPFKISRNRVTEENASVKILNQKDPLLHYPNKIDAQDFDNWVQERGLYFPTDIDPNYTVLFEMNDKGEAPNSTSLMYARFGKGIFIYTGLSFFRQIPAGHTGAIKLFINCLELK